MQEDKFQAIQAATRAGNKIEAIKLYIELFGVGLVEAKDAIEHLEVSLRDGAATSIPSPAMMNTAPGLRVPPDTMAKIRAALLGGQKIAAIKHYREIHHVGLAEAKGAIDSLEAELRLESPQAFTSPSGAGGLTFLAFVIVLAAVGYGVWRLLEAVFEVSPS
ncbi:MAG: hypothetical protein JWO89_685 [Verrucomicrobiaceae bacterium]|nr:hypothetical protein [Verrucomicrobiaceae bacterium]